MHLKKYLKNNIDLLFESIKRTVFDLEDYLFEKRFKLDLRGVIRNEQLVAQDREALLHATAYQSVWCRNLRELLLESAKYDFSFKYFIDIGSGKGKACFYASQNKFFLLLK